MSLIHSLFSHHDKAIEAEKAKMSDLSRQIHEEVVNINSATREKRQKTQSTARLSQRLQERITNVNSLTARVLSDLERFHEPK